MKDPALLFYTSDFLTGTMTMTNDQVGKYIRLLCLQHQKGTLSEKDMLHVCGTYDVDIYSKFVKDDTGYYNIRMRFEADRRKNFCDSRKRSRQRTFDVRGTYEQRTSETNTTKIETVPNGGTPQNDSHINNITYKQKERTSNVRGTYVRRMETETITATEAVSKGDTPLEVCNTNNNTYKQPVDNLLITCGKPVDNYSKIKKGFVPPTIEEVREYCQSRKNSIDPQYFVDRNSATGWVDKRGVAYKDWKAVIRIWETYDNTRRTNNARPSSKLPQELTPDL